MGMRKGRSRIKVTDNAAAGVSAALLALGEIVYVTTSGQHFIMTHNSKVTYAFESGYGRDVTDRYADMDSKALSNTQIFRISAYTQGLMRGEE